MGIREIIKYFIAWRILLFVFLFLAISFLPLQKNFLGGGFANYTSAPYFWTWANFDGEHYLRIAQEGYGPFSYFFFPVYPFLIRFVARLLGGGLFHFAVSGLIISHLAFFIGLVGLIKLIKLDYPKKVVEKTILLLLIFPTSFYFASVYTESLFLAQVVWSFYFARRGNWIWASFLGAVSTATRIVGVALFPALVVEALIQAKEKKINLFLPIISSFAVMFGLIAYALFLNKEVGDPLAFFHSLNQVFGEQRATNLVFLPQVFYRYIFKILPNLNYTYFPVVFTTWLEFLTGTAFGILGVLGILVSLAPRLRSGSVRRLRELKFRLSYAAFLLLGYLIPTFSGSFSSLPRYVLVLFPAFILLAYFFEMPPKAAKVAFLLVLLILLGVATALFVRGYWVS